MKRLLTLRKEFPVPTRGEYAPLFRKNGIESAGVALEVDTFLPEAVLVGWVTHACDICWYVQVQLVFVAFTFKLFVTKDEATRSREFALGIAGEDETEGR
jgi:hypothetical protein